MTVARICTRLSMLRLQQAVNPQSGRIADRVMGEGVSQIAGSVAHTSSLGRAGLASFCVFVGMLFVLAVVRALAGSGSCVGAAPGPPVHAEE